MLKCLVKKIICWSKDKYIFEYFEMLNSIKEVISTTVRALAGSGRRMESVVWKACVPGVLSRPQLLASVMVTGLFTTFLTYIFRVIFEHSW